MTWHTVVSVAYIVFTSFLISDVRLRQIVSERGTPSAKHSPAYGTLAIGWTLRHAQGLAHLGLREAQRQSTDLEHLRELLDVVQIDAIHYVVGGLVDGRLICN